VNVCDHCILTLERLSLHRTINSKLVSPRVIKSSSEQRLMSSLRMDDTSQWSSAYRHPLFFGCNFAHLEDAYADLAHEPRLWAVEYSAKGPNPTHIYN